MHNFLIFLLGAVSAESISILILGISVIISNRGKDKCS